MPGKKYRSIKRPAVYESVKKSLRKQGVRGQEVKRRAAAIANSSRGKRR